MNKFKHILLKDVDRVEKIGEGTFGQVYKAEYTDENNQKQMIAMKKFRYFDKEQQGISVTTISEMKFLKKLDHPNIVKLLEIKKVRPNKSESNKMMGNIYMIFEFASNDLQGLMNNPQVKFELPHLKCLMHDILNGMLYLHRQNIIHRDIKGANILVSDDGRAQIADFGLARMIQP